MKRSAAASPAEQESFAEELDRRVAQRTAELTAANEQLRKELDEHKRAEEALRESELNFNLIVDSIPLPVAVTSPTGEVEALNQPTLEYFGRTFEELKGWKSSDVVHPDDLGERSPRRWTRTQPAVLTTSRAATAALMAHTVGSMFLACPCAMHEGTSSIGSTYKLILMIESERKKHSSLSNAI